MGVKVAKVFVQKMKTKWGSCNHGVKSIRLNTDLATKLIECLEYVVVHEMTHIIEPTHNDRFAALLGTLMPRWRFYKDKLNGLPIRHVDWIN